MTPRLITDDIVDWLLAGDVAIQYQVHRDLLDEERPDLRAHALTMNRIGDLWRDFAYEAGRLCKGRAEAHITFPYLADKLAAIGKEETAFFKQLHVASKPL